MAQARPTRKQHFVPQLLLKGFATSDHIHCFDKKTETVSTPSLADAAEQRDFYVFRTASGGRSLEDRLQKIEGFSGPLIDSIREKRALSHLGQLDCRKLALFTALQLTRGPQEQRFYATVGERIRAIARANHPDASNIADITETNAETDRSAAISHILVHAVASHQILLAKNWALLSSPPDEMFLIGDHPVVKHSHHPSSPLYPNTGLLHPGIQVYLPISSTLTLAFLCPSLLTGPDAPQASVVQAIHAGTLVLAPTMTTELLNRLQVVWSDRFVFSISDNFDLPRAMIASNPRYKTSPQLLL